MKSIRDGWMDESKLNALSKSECYNCGDDLKWSMAGWVHRKSGNGVCFSLDRPERATPKEDYENL